jgi:murein DD-endopeptidase MepM/ murein hydrolase activator NlpD
MECWSSRVEAAILVPLLACLLGACAQAMVPELPTSPPPAPVAATVDPPSSASATPSPEVVVAAALPAPAPSGPRSPPLRDDRFRSPMPGGYIGGWFGDTGLDIAGNHLPVYAIAAGTLDYAERGHTLWMTAPDTPLSIRIALDAPVPWKGHHVTHVYYTHMSRLEVEQAEGSPLRRHVEAGELIGTSGIGNGVAHLHLGVLMDGLVEQDSWAGILREDDIRKLFGGYKNGELLPKASK